MSLIEAILIAIVEGLTEFLPVSSTGHMVIASSFMGIAGDDFTKLFEVAIQLGAILAVVLVYYKKFIQFNDFAFYAKLVVGVIPALLFGLVLNDLIDSMLEKAWIVAVSMVAGGFILIYIDRLFPQPGGTAPDLTALETTPQELIEADVRLSYKKAFAIGLWQVLAMIPGVSRSAASIIGGMQQGLTRNFAAEFSFFLAVPTMVAASGHSLFLKNWKAADGTMQKGYELITASQGNIIAFATGNIVAFIVALLAIRFFITYLKRYGFRVFGIYRVIVGSILLVLIAAGVIS